MEKNTNCSYRKEINNYLDIFTPEEMKIVFKLVQPFGERAQQREQQQQLSICK